MAYPGSILAIPAPMTIVEFTTAGSSTWTVPAGVKRVFVTVVGGGGAGGAASSTTVGSGGGGAGAVYYRWPLSVTPGAVLPYVVGAGGVGAINTVGGTGTASSFAGMMATPGKGGSNLASIAGGGDGGSFGGVTCSGAVSWSAGITGVAATSPTIDTTLSWLYGTAAFPGAGGGAGGTISYGLPWGGGVLVGGTSGSFTNTQTYNGGPGAGGFAFGPSITSAVGGTGSANSGAAAISPTAGGANSGSGGGGVGAAASAYVAGGNGGSGYIMIEY